jgi:hypothetical protein
MSNGVACGCETCNKFRKSLIRIMKTSPERLKPFILYMMGCMADDIRIADLERMQSASEEELFENSKALPEVSSWVSQDTGARAGVSMDQIENRAKLLLKFTKDNTPDPELWVYTMLFTCMELSEDPRLTVVLGGILGTLKQPHGVDLPMAAEGSEMVN